MRISLPGGASRYHSNGLLAMINSPTPKTQPLTQDISFNILRFHKPASYLLSNNLRQTYASSYTSRELEQPSRLLLTKAICLSFRSSVLRLSKPVSAPDERKLEQRRCAL